MMLNLLMPFHDQSEAFAYGFEAGALWGTMSANQRTIEGTYHEANHQQLLLCAQVNHYQVLSVSDIGSGWVKLRFQRSIGRWLLGFIPEHWLFNLQQRLGRTLGVKDS